MSWFSPPTRCRVRGEAKRESRVELVASSDRGLLRRWIASLTNDRTFLTSHFRTTIALFGLGFVVAKIALIVQPDATRLENKDLYSTVGVLIVLSGAALVVVGCLQHAHFWRLLHSDEAPQPRWPLTITVIAFVGSLVLSALIIVST